jgi:hypothetical protein
LRHYLQPLAQQLHAFSGNVTSYAGCCQMTS